MREHTRSSPPPQEGQTCAACTSPLQGPRCESCGAPVSPGGFRILRQLAQGPHSRLFLAEREGRRVALKELLFALVPDAERLEGFEREAEFLRQLKHPRIPRLLASFREGSGVHTRLYLAQEFVEGHSLLEELEQHRFSEPEVRRIARQVLEVLVYLHDLSPQVIHRDLKPANLMRRPDGELALVDFGSARDLVRGATHRSTLVGTFGYMPPEQLGGTVDETSDLYALGATLIHLLSRKSPDALLRSGMEIAFEEAVNASAGMKAFLARLTERERSQRFPSARAALEALDALEQKRPVPVSTRPPSSQRQLILVALAAAALTVTGAMTALMFDSEPPMPPPPPPARTLPPKVELPPPPPVLEATPTTPPTPTTPEIPPASRPKPASRSSSVPPEEVAEVITLRPASQSRPFLLPKDVRVAMGREVSLGDTAACGPQPSTAEVEQVELQAEGGGTLEAPRSRLSVDVTLKNRGASGPGCHKAVLRLKDGSGQLLAPETSFENTSTGTVRSRTVSFTFPRTQREVRLEVGTANAPGTAFVLDLVRGTFR
ncbi:serine/threonine protein kinase [Hyalangium rubrum]|uniref:non-specific serine/threonine protein kinase n=1 Tax=Hyalangium rubrum TaxID=3103134 RepID=A0ABU5HGA9_9BACT|nr:protein kinase [Hyalangium sp. s54d21]MDY7232276.1 protein kinase [Hyalangium sp. s54d21]